MFRKTLTNISLIIISTVVSVAAIDLAARMFYDRHILVRPTPIFKNTWTVNERLARYDENVSFSGKIIGDLAAMNYENHGVERNVTFITDDNGFRNSPEALQRNNNVILAGDSFGAGGGASQEDMLCSLLNKDINYKCYNISIGGFGPWQEFMTLKYEYKNIPKTDNAIILWLLFTGNDLDDDYDPNFEDSQNGLIYRCLIKTFTYFNRSPVRRIFLHFIRGNRHKSNSNVVARNHAGKTILFYKPYMVNTNRTLNQVRKHRNYNRFINTLNKMTEFCKKNKLTIAVVLVPAKEEIYKWLIEGKEAWSTHYKPSALSEAIRQVMNHKDFYFLDLKPVFLKKSRELYQEQKKYLYWNDDTHWNDYGQKAAFVAVSNILRKIQHGSAPGGN